MNRELRHYFEAAALGNGSPRRFVELVRNTGAPLLFLHFLLAAAALNFPVMFALARLTPYELYSRLYGASFPALLPPGFAAAEGALPPAELIDDFNLLLYREGYGRAVLLPLTALCFALMLILQALFYLCGAFCLGLSRMNSSPLSFRERLGLFIMASTLPALGAAVFGLWLPTVHIIVFYLALIPLVFSLIRRCDREEGGAAKKGDLGRLPSAAALAAVSVSAASVSASCGGGFPAAAYPVSLAPGEIARYDGEDFREKYTYTGDDLGAVYGPEKTVFKVWSPGAEQIEVLLYPAGTVKPREEPSRRVPMFRERQGVWKAEVLGDIKNSYYVYRVSGGGLSRDAVDPYARAVGVNGLRGMVIDLAETDPPGFREEPRPPLAAPVDAVIYELHLRDLSVHPRSGIARRGKFLGLAEGGTKNAGGLSTGLDHILELGVSHIHLLPVFDFRTVDEADISGGQFNWGYDPQNYNAPEGSYATDPFDGAVRVREFKEMVQALHRRGLGLIMDVVYNHTYSAEGSSFSVLAPGYYYRTDRRGRYADGSACGNETASERPMVRKFILDSVIYWAREYRIDGFRFDLMGLHDIETMNALRRELDKIDPAIILYGEGWTAGDSPLPPGRRAIKANAPLLDRRIAVFSDDIRDGIKGSVSRREQGGFIHGADSAEDVKFGILGGTEHPQVDIRRVRYSDLFWARGPSQSVNYVSAHDNLSLWDKLMAVNPGADEEALIGLNKLAAALVLTSQGIPFFQAGEEMARTKGGDENSYKSPDAVNMLDWDRKSRFLPLVEYYRGLIALRKAYAPFRLRTAGEIRGSLRFLETPPSVIAYTLGNSGGEGYPVFALIFNGGAGEAAVRLPAGEWDILVNAERAGTSPLGRVSGGSISVPGKSALVLGGEESE